MKIDDDEKGLLDAVNAAIDEETYEAPDDEVQDEPETSTEDGDSGDDVNSGDEPAAEADEGDAESDDGEDSSSEPDDDTDEEPVEETDEDKDEKAEKPKDEEPPEDGKEPDPVNDPIPESVTQRTRERIESLVSRVKETEQYKANYTELVGMIESTGATPEAFNNMLNYMRMVNSKDPDDRRQALKAAQSELRALAVQLGEKDVPGFNPVSEFDDLQRAVEAQELSEDMAREIAVNRLKQQDELTRQTQSQQEQQAQMSAQQAVQQGQQSLTQLETQLRADPEYQAKRDILVPMLKNTMRQIHPSQWAGVFEEAYRNLKLPAAPPAPRPKPPKNQPLRGKSPAGNSDKGINSPIDALNEALGSMGR